MNIDTDQARQVEVLSRYIIGTSVRDSRLDAIYSHACQQGMQPEKIVGFAFKHPSLLPFLDAGLVFIRPNSELRRRIHVVFATLESMPEYASKFMPEKVSFLALLGLVLVGVRAVFRAIIGIILIKVVRL